MFMAFYEELAPPPAAEVVLSDGIIDGKFRPVCMLLDMF